MIESDNILEFIDGTLDPEAEQILFDSMARQPELRTMLRQYIMIGEGVRSDREAFAPPASLEYALMSGLGLAPLAEIAPAVTTGGWLAKVGAFGKIWSVVGAFVTGAILASGGTYLLTRSGDTNYVQVQPTPGSMVAPQAQVQTQQQVQTPPAAPAVPQVQAPVVATLPRAEVTRRSGGGQWGTGTRLTPPTSPTVESVTTSDKESPESVTFMDSLNVGKVSLKPAENAPNRILETSDTTAKSMNRVASSRVPVESVMSHLEATEEASKLTVFELRGQLMAQSVSTSVREVAPQRFENTAAGFYWRASDQVMLGFEGGFERYAQTLGVYSGDTLLIEQMPVYGWGGLSARFNLMQLPIAVMGSEIGTFVQVTGGWTTVGPLARGRVGFDWAVPGMPLSPKLTAAFEASSLAYNFRGQSLISARYGFTGGIQFSLF